MSPTLLPLTCTAPQAMATDLSGNPTFGTLLHDRVRITCLESYDHSVLPTKVVSRVGHGHMHPAATSLVSHGHIHPAYTSLVGERLL